MTDIHSLLRMRKEAYFIPLFAAVFLVAGLFVSVDEVAAQVCPSENANGSIQCPVGLSWCDATCQTEPTCTSPKTSLACGTCTCQCPGGTQDCTATAAANCQTQPATSCPTRKRVSQCSAGSVLSCGACVNGFTDCAGSLSTCIATSDPSCAAPKNWDACTSTCTDPYILVSPASAQSASISVTGNVEAASLTIAGNVEAPAYCVNGGSMCMSFAQSLGPEERPWGDRSPGANGPFAGDYNMGYRFVPLVDGVISQLGARCKGGVTRTVRIYDVATQAVLTSVAVTPSGETAWTWESITPLAVTAGKQYMVSGYGSGGYCWFTKGNAAAGSDVLIEGGVYIVGSAGLPTTFSSSNIYGQTDIVFQAGSGGAGYNVGIGTVSPEEQLDVAGNIKASQFCLGADCLSSWSAASPWSISGIDVYRITGNVGIGTMTVPEKLTVDGTAQMTGFKLTTGAGVGKVLTSDASGVGTWQAGACSGGKYSNLSTGSYNGATLGSYSAVNTTACGAGKHICTPDEILRSIHCAVTLPASGTGWVANGPPGFTSPAANDCGGWISASSTAYGTFWQFAGASGGNGAATSCDLTMKVACCQ